MLRSSVNPTPRHQASPAAASGQARHALAAVRDFQPLLLPADAQPVLFVVVDTEEEFDWTAPFSRNNTSVRAIRHIERIQKLFARFRVTPTYVIDFPVASQPEGYEPLRDMAAHGNCRIGAHLHPWVNPPFREEVNQQNSYGCNLAAELEAEKIRILKLEIGNNLNVDARTYKAGRYGLGPSTMAALENLAFDVDLSVNPYMDFSHDGGPSFASFDPRPFVFGDRRMLLEVPCTTDYTGVAGELGPRLYPIVSRESLRIAHLVGIFARLGILNRVMLSPEGFTLAELQQLTETLLRRGIRTFSLTFHSPSLAPGYTPYVRTASELDRFVTTINDYLDFFFGKVGGAPSTPEEFRQSVDQHAAFVVADNRPVTLQEPS